MKKKRYVFFTVIIVMVLFYLISHHEKIPAEISSITLCYMQVNGTEDVTSESKVILDTENILQISKQIQLHNLHRRLMQSNSKSVSASSIDIVFFNGDHLTSKMTVYEDGMLFYNEKQCSFGFQSQNNAKNLYQYFIPYFAQN